VSVAFREKRVLSLLLFIGIVNWSDRQSRVGEMSLLGAAGSTVGFL